MKIVVFTARYLFLSCYKVCRNNQWTIYKTQEQISPDVEMGRDSSICIEIVLINLCSWFDHTSQAWGKKFRDTFVEISVLISQLPWCETWLPSYTAVSSSFQKPINIIFSLISESRMAHFSPFFAFFSQSPSPVSLLRYLIDKKILFW